MIKGLTDKEVNESIKKHGTNEISSKRTNSFFKLLLESFGDPIIRILLIALGIKTVLLLKSFDWYETIGIVIAIFIASLISSISEYGSEKAFIRLQEEASKINSRVLRNSKVKEVKVDEVVVGDIVILNSGDKIPADGVVVEGGISVDESSINGETKENNKDTHNNKLYRGTVVYSGSAKMLVTTVGDKTFYGKMASELTEASPPSPLKLRLANLAKFISKIGYFSAVLTSLSYLFSVIFINNNFDYNLIRETVTNFPIMFGHILYALTLSVTVIVVAVPEGLPMMITLVLSSNMKRMLKKNVLVRKLVGIETSGSLNILFTDKTGTLTKGKLEVVEVVTPTLKSYSNLVELEKHNKYYELVSKSLIYNNEAVYDTDNNKVIGGNITDKALLEFIKKTKQSNIKVISNIPFDSKNKYSITVIEDKEKLKLIKGAPEVIIKNCDTYYDEYGDKKILKGTKDIFDNITNITNNGIRVIALATSKDINTTKLDNLTFLGLILIKDEVRKESIEGVKLVNNAGIQVVMITGDNKNTAIAIAKEVGIINNKDDITLTSDELNKMTNEEVKAILPKLKVLSRSMPQDKSRLVTLAQELNLVTGMTGDGVNDAPALKKADVGFAMGSGTEVSKEASDIVILDDNILSISNSILFGRTIFKSIRKFIIFQLTVNLCAVSVSLIGPFIGIEMPITVIQMLWINMVMDTLAGIAFSYEAPLKEYMNEPPKRKDEHIVNKYMLHEIIFTGMYTSILCIFFLKSDIIKNIYPTDIKLMTAFFGLFIFSSLFNSFNARTNRLNLLSRLYKNKVFVIVILFVILIQVYLIYYGGSLFRTVPLNLREFTIMILLSTTVIPIDFLRKITLRLNKRYDSV